MKPSDLRRDAYVLSSMAKGFEQKADGLQKHNDILHLFLTAGRLEDAAASLREAIEHMNARADELEAQE